MKRLLVIAVAAGAAFGMSSAADARPRCPDLVCGTRCFQTPEVRFCV